MGSTRPEREYARARADYLAAARNLVTAMAARVPLPGAEGDLADWTPHQIRVTAAAALAGQQLAGKRRELDACARVPSACPPPAARPGEPNY